MPQRLRQLAPSPCRTHSGVPRAPSCRTRALWTGGPAAVHPSTPLKSCTPAEVWDLAPSSAAMGAHRCRPPRLLKRAGARWPKRAAPHTPWVPAPANLHPRVAPAQIGSSSPSLASPRTNTAARVGVPVEGSLEPSSRRTPPARAVEPRRRPPPSPNRLQESSLGDLTAAYRPRPADPRRRLAGIWPEPRRPTPKGHIAKPQLIPGRFVQGEGIFMNLQKIQGADCEAITSIVFVFCRILSNL
jgi:hypothetical protein